MAELTIHQITMVKYLIDPNKISTKELQLDLLDHICCDIENLMNKGHDFDYAYKVCANTYHGSYLQQLDKATQFLTNNNTMKTKTIILGVSAFSLSTLAYVGKMLDLAGSNEVLVIGTALFIFGFLLSITLNFTRSLDVSLIKNTGWLGFLGASGISIGLMLSLLKYYVAAYFSFGAGGLLLVISFYLLATRVKMLIS
ncbi:MAG: hypothetical protein AAGF85_04045 [Bacteroidota bacterium]